MKLEFLQREIGDGLKGYEELENDKIQLNLKHFLQPDADKKGFPTGFHYNYLGHYKDKYKVTKAVDLKNGCYIAKWFNGVKWKTSSFVPDNITRLEYVKSVKEAYYNLINKVANADASFNLIGGAKNGIIFEMETTGKGVVNTAYPCIKKMSIQ